MYGEKGIKEENRFMMTIVQTAEVNSRKPSSNLQQLFGNFDGGIKAWRFI